MDTRLRVGPLDQPRTVELVGPGRAPDVGTAQPRQRGAHRDAGATVRRRQPQSAQARWCDMPVAQRAQRRPMPSRLRRADSTCARCARNRATRRRIASRWAIGLSGDGGVGAGLVEDVLGQLVGPAWSCWAPAMTAATRQSTAAAARSARGCVDRRDGNDLVPQLLFSPAARCSSPSYCAAPGVQHAPPGWCRRTVRCARLSASTSFPVTARLPALVCSSASIGEGANAGERPRRDDPPVADVPHLVGRRRRAAPR